MIGSIVLWYGDPVTIPAGWQVCDGTNGTPDMRNRFAAGANSFAVVPKSSVTGPALATGGAANASAVLNLGNQISETPASDLSKTSQDFSIVPPFVALYYIMRLS